MERWREELAETHPKLDWQEAIARYPFASRSEADEYNAYLDGLAEMESERRAETPKPTVVFGAVGMERRNEQMEMSWPEHGPMASGEDFTPEKMEAA